MRLTFARPDLLTALNAVVPAIPNASTMPVLSNVFIDATDSDATFTATDMDVTLSAKAGAEVDAGGRITVPCRKLQEIVRNLPSEEVEMRVKALNMEISSGESVFRLRCLPSGDFPELPAINYAAAAKMRTEVLRELTKHVAFAVSTEESRPILKGVFWEIGSGVMSMVATNGHRMAKMTVPADEWPGGETSLLVSQHGLHLASRTFGEDGDVTVAQTDNWLGLTTDTRTLVMRLIDGKYPDYSRVVPKTHEREATVDVKALAAAVRRVALVASKQTHRVGMTFKNGLVSITADTPDLGEATDIVAANYMGEAFSIGFNASYLVEHLDAMPDGELRMEFGTNEQAAVMMPVVDNGYFCLVMPLRMI